jgi:hypothetical protein
MIDTIFCLFSMSGDDAFMEVKVQEQGGVVQELKCSIFTLFSAFFNEYFYAVGEGNYSTAKSKKKTGKQKVVSLQMDF